MSKVEERVGLWAAIALLAIIAVAVVVQARKPVEWGSTPVQTISYVPPLTAEKYHEYIKDKMETLDARMARARGMEPNDIRRSK